MKVRARALLMTAAAAAIVVLVAGAVAPFFTVETYARRLQASLSRALGRPVELGNVHFSLFKGPGFSVDRVIIYEDPSNGSRPIEGS